MDTSIAAIRAMITNAGCYCGVVTISKARVRRKRICGHTAIDQIVPVGGGGGVHKIRVTARTTAVSKVVRCTSHDGYTHISIIANSS
eukprot:CAMPEP_0175043452 /NCGR_PEP_ID=MMETSP0052_2-20121109/3198_1 /TAXON_ID=51329 ORGANISM="Polytomella parva, Strain SAG 63-3" /NCGR_SAMPLE_ID=MMETSP0052_2 /ASSEMBLY_ACC=CAM_ASM_000194 /LENGTH=86 /DNA_ID=CAMNT_0016306519 /DNA_START=593 /DNA_END=850 /DNA_ORIENTATION=-